MLSKFLRYTPLLSLLLSTNAQTLVPFTIDGFLDSAVANGTKYNSGGTAVVMGNTILIPDNTQVQFPNTFVPWVDFVNGTLGTGAHEVIISGNIVDGTAIAAVMQISGLMLQLSNGVISAINADGSISLEDGGPTLRINDPTGKFGPAFTGLPFFAVDPVSPSITSFGGFPMCVPRSANDPQCPKANRPAGTAGSTFTVADGTHMVPFAVGDYLTFSGVEFNGEMVVYSIIADVGVYSEKPGYLVVSAINIAPADLTNNANLEAGTTRFTGYTTSNIAVVSIIALDADPCTGELTERVVVPSVVPERQPVPGRYQWDIKPTITGPYTQQWRFRLSTGVVNTTDGILGGQYDAPTITYIYPELITPGAPVVQTDFSQFGWLANGPGADANGNVFHQLSPWPGSPVPTPSKICPDKIVPPTPPPPGSNISHIPLSISATNITVLPGVQATITAQQTQPNVTASDLSWLWTEISPSESLTLTGANTDTLSFVVPAPQTAATLVRTFNVEVTHIPTASTANATVTVTGDNSASDTVTIISYTIANAMAGSVSVVASTDLVGDAKSTMTIGFNGGAGVPMTNIGAGQFQYAATHFGQTADAIVVTSVSGAGKPVGSASASGLISKKKRSPATKIAREMN